MARTTKAPHYRGAYHVTARHVRAQAYANPGTRCWRCGLTLPEHKPHRNGRPATWQAGHVNDGQVNGPLAPEASTCNTSAGAAHGNRTRHAATRSEDPYQ